MNYESIVILSGAGLSADSGVATFRDAGGFWAQYDIEDVATPQGFSRNPTLVHQFYNMRRRQLSDVTPNAAHRALAKLEHHMHSKGCELVHITQNVDNLMEQAGAKNIWHMHGELTKARCLNCESIHLWTDDLSIDTTCPVCKKSTGMRPHIVWFGEIPLEMEKIFAALSRADLFVSIGTSGSVYPAAAFVAEAQAAGIETMEMNLEPSANHQFFHTAEYGPAAEIVPAWVKKIIGG